MRAHMQSHWVGYKKTGPNAPLFFMLLLLLTLGGLVFWYDCMRLYCISLLGLAGDLGVMDCLLFFTFIVHFLDAHSILCDGSDDRYRKQDFNRQ